MQEMDAGDFESALLHICPAIDATSKLEFSEIKNVGERYKKFLKTNNKIISSIGIGVCVHGDVITPFDHPEIKTDASGQTKLEDILYHVVRCGLIHEGSIGEHIEFHPTISFQNKENKKLILNQNMVLGLIVSVILAPVNYLHYMATNPKITMRGKVYHLNEWWGQRDLFIKELVS